MNSESLSTTDRSGKGRKAGHPVDHPVPHGVAHGLAHGVAHGVAHTPGAPTLEADDVWVSYDGSLGAIPYGSPYALEAVTFRVDPGERIAVVGPNGAGKSTLFRLIAGTLRPERGRIRIFGQRPSGHICVAFVPQRNQVDWNFPVTVEDVVMMGRAGQIGLLRRAGKQDREIVRTSLLRVGATALAGKRMGELSGGQQQRVFLARALAQEAELVLLDEPFNGLDAPSQEAIVSILDDLRQEGVTVMVATHDLDLAAGFFDRIMLLNRRIVAFGPPATALGSDNLLSAYGGHLHVIGSDKAMLLADTCCEGE